MRTFSFGQPEGAIIQVSFVVEDLDASLRAFADEYGLGPWRRYRLGPDAEGLVYHGKPVHMDLSLALSFSGSLMVEIVEQHCQTPSVFREHVERVGYGLHHLARGSVDFDRDRKRLEESGREVVYSACTSGGSRIAFFEGVLPFDSYLELIEVDETTEEIYHALKQAAESTGGTTAVWTG